MADQYDEEFDEVYDDEGREDLQSNDEISPTEQAFMKGYDEREEDDSDENEDEDYEKTFDES